MIVVPFFSAWHAPLVEAALSAGGEECCVLAGLDAGADVVRAGLETVNNDACYATLLAAGRTVGLLRVSGDARDVARANTCSGAIERCPGTSEAAHPLRVVLPTPCVHCRGDDAPYLVREALVASGLGAGVSVVDGAEALEALVTDPRAASHLADAVAFGDVLLQARLCVRPYVYDEKELAFDALLAAWSARACDALVADRFSLEDNLRVIAAARADFGVPARDGRPGGGIGGAAPAVFDECMNAGLVSCIEREGCEVTLPYLLPLVGYALREKAAAAPLRAACDERCLVLQRHAPVGFRCPTVQDLERAGTEVVPCFLAQGAGWTIAGFARLFVQAGVCDLVYARAFGCLAGHVVGQGAIKPLRTRCAADDADVNIATIEFDPGTSEVNQLNRIKLMATIAKRETRIPTFNLWNR